MSQLNISSLPTCKPLHLPVATQWFVTYLSIDINKNREQFPAQKVHYPYLFNHLKQETF